MEQSPKIEMETNDNGQILNAERELQLLRQTTDVLKSLSRIDDLEAYAQDLKKLLANVHRIILDAIDPTTGSPIDLGHFEYRSLLIKTKQKSVDGKTQVRGVFSKETSSPSHLEQFALLAQPYEPGWDILPQIDCDFCTLAFRPNSLPDDWFECVSRGFYPIGKGGIRILSELLSREAELHPWRLRQGQVDKAFEQFQQVQRDISSQWDVLVRGGQLRLPDSQGVFEFALKSSLTTMLILSDELWEYFCESRLRESVEAAKKDEVAQLDALRQALRGQLGNDSVSDQFRRALTFLPIRMPKENGNDEIQETIGLVAYYSRDPLGRSFAASLALMERLVFLTCRQQELFRLQDQLQRQLVDLEMQRVFSQLITHEAARPLGAVKDSLALIEHAMEGSAASLRRFVRGDFRALQKQHNVDLYDIMLDIKERQAPTLQEKQISYKDDVRRGTYVYADNNAVRYTLGILVDNAIVHGQKHIHVWTRHDDLEHVVACVANDGEPMPQELEEAIRQGRPPVRPLDEGKENLGVGLSLVYEFARLNQWQLNYHREEQSPLIHVFELRLPRAKT